MKCPACSGKQTRRYGKVGKTEYWVCDTCHHVWERTLK